MVIYEGQNIKIGLDFCQEIVVEKHIQSGAYGDVYKVENCETGTYYALKHIRIKKKNIDSAVASALKIGIEAGINIESPYVVQKKGFLKLDTFEYAILFKYAGENDLADWIEDKKTAKPEIKQNLFIKILEGIQAIHKKGIIHHDLKPQNILITKKDIPQIIDFGLTKIVNKDVVKATGRQGTPAYIPPENYIGIETTKQADIFSLGCILYELIRGKNYFKICGFDNMPPLDQMIKNDKLVKKNILDFDKKFPIKNEFDAQIAEIIKKSTAFNPTDRYSTIEQFLDDVLQNAAHTKNKRHSQTAPLPSDTTFQIEIDDLKAKLRKLTAQVKNLTSSVGIWTLETYKYKKRSNILATILGFAVLTIFVLSFAISHYSKTNKSLEMERDDYSTKLHKASKDAISYQTQLDAASTKVTEYQNMLHEEKLKKKKVEDVILKVGKLKDTKGLYDAGYKLFFEVKEKILLRSVKIAAKSTNSIDIILYDNYDEKISELSNILITKKERWQRVDLNFEIDEGKYSLAFTGDNQLFYDADGINYPYNAGAVKITGSGKTTGKQGYYEYFFDWQFSLLAD